MGAAIEAQQRANLLFHPVLLTQNQLIATSASSQIRSDMVYRGRLQCFSAMSRLRQCHIGPAGLADVEVAMFYTQ